jgi:hypothetical protein
MSTRIDTTIDVELDSAVGPRVIAPLDASPEEIIAALPRGWQVHDEDWSNGIALPGGRVSYPLSRTRGRPERAVPREAISQRWEPETVEAAAQLAALLAAEDGEKVSVTAATERAVHEALERAQRRAAKRAG